MPLRLIDGKTCHGVADRVSQLQTYHTIKSNESSHGFHRMQFKSHKPQKLIKSTNSADLLPSLGLAHHLSIYTPKHAKVMATYIFCIALL